MTMKRILALLMCLTMTLSLLPFSFAAEDPDSGEPTSVSETAAAAETGDPAPAEPAEPEAPAEPDPAPVAPTDQVELTEENTVPESAAPNLEQSPDPEPASAPQEESAQDEKQDNKIPFEHKKLKDKKNGVTITGMVPADAGIRFADVRDDLVPAPNMRDLKSGVKGLFRAPAKAPAQAETGSDSALGLNRDNVLAAYDLKLVDENGEAVLPDGKVTVTLDVSDLDLPENVRVLHYLDSAAAIEAALAAQKADPDHANRVDYVDDADLVENEVLADALAATREYTGDDEELGLYVETILPEVDGDTLSFETGSFSVYAVVGEGEETPEARATVNFYGVDPTAAPVATLYVKNSDTLEELDDIVHDPGAGELNGLVFKGWYIGTTDNYTVETEGMTIEGVRAYLENLDIKEGVTVNVYAMVFKSFTVTYYGESNEVLSSDAVLLRRNVESMTYTVNQLFTPASETQAFFGWLGDSVSSDGKITSAVYNGETITDGTYPNGTILTLKGSIDLRVNAPYGQWLVFNTIQKGATYVAPQFVKDGETTKAPTNEMTCLGYTFGGWYQDEACTQPFEFGHTLSQKTNVYAKWIKHETADYTVIIWKQNIAGTKTETDGEGNETTTKLYDYVEAVTVRNARVDSVPSAVNATTGSVTGAGYAGETGFHFSETDQASKTVTADGNTVVNVYYDRNEYTLQFQIDGEYYTETTGNTGTQYGLVDGEYVQLTRSGNSWSYTKYTYTPGYDSDHDNNPEKYGLVNGEYVRVRWHDGWFNDYWYYGDDQYTTTNRYTGDVYARSSQTVSYTGTRYTRENGWHTIKEITALYQQPIGENFPIVGTNGVTYNNGERWDPQQNNVDLNEVIVYLETMPNGDVTFRLNTSSASTKTMNYYVEVLPGTTGTVTYNGKQYTLYNTVNANYNGVTVEDYIEIIGCTKSGVSPSYTHNNGNFTYYVNTNGSNIAATTVNFYYTRNLYDINYMDGSYFDGYGNRVEETNRGQLANPDSNIPFGTDLTPYGPGGENYKGDLNYSGYTFAGWYVDKSCSVPYTFGTTMPDGGVTVYAKWIQNQYRVFLHPNALLSDGTRDASLSWGDESATEKQQMTFRVSEGGKVSVPTGTRNDYDMIGWFMDEACTIPFNAEDFQLTYNSVTANYDKTQDMTDDMDKWGIITNPPGTNSDATGYNGGDRFWVTKKLDLYAGWRAVISGAKGINVLYDPNGGSNAPSDTNFYPDRAKAIAQAASTAPAKQVFLYWVVQKWDGSAYVDVTETVDGVQSLVTVSPGDTFEVLKAYAKQTEKEDTTDSNDLYSYTVQLRAEYGPENVPTPTHITWYDNYAGGGKKTDSNLQINKAVDIEAARTRPGYTFLGWARVPTTDASGKPLPDYSLAPKSLGEADLFLKYEGGVFKALIDGEWTKVTQVAADEKAPYHDLYAVWSENYVTIEYKVATAYEDMGAVPEASETIKADTGSPDGSTATANAGYQFVGWYKDDDCKEQITDATWLRGNQITPQKEGGVYKSATYYAKFEPALSSLTITKTGMNPGETAVFTVSGGSTSITVSVPGNGGRVTIDGLQIGTTYTVTEDPGWAWKYTPTYKVYNNERNTITISDNAADNVMMVSNTKKTGTTPNTNWLTAASSAVNNWAKQAAEAAASTEG